jgi:mRNA interferase MazF
MRALGISSHEDLTVRHAALDPTRRSEIQKTRPCVLVSPDELNGTLRTVIVAPLTTGGQSYPFRVACRFANKSGHVVVDQ